MAAAAIELQVTTKPGEALAGVIGTKDGLGFALGDCAARPVAAPAMYLGWLLIAKNNNAQAVTCCILYNRIQPDNCAMTKEYRPDVYC